MGLGWSLRAAVVCPGPPKNIRNFPLDLRKHFCFLELLMQLRDWISFNNLSLTFCSLFWWKSQHLYMSSIKPSTPSLKFATITRCLLSIHTISAPWSLNLRSSGEAPPTTAHPQTLVSAIAAQAKYTGFSHAVPAWCRHSLARAAVAEKAGGASHCHTA